jgi:hypothetical protein
MRFLRSTSCLALFALGACNASELRPVPPVNAHVPHREVASDTPVRIASCSPSAPPRADATFLGDVPEKRIPTEGGFVLRKECDAYKTFGGYDVAYTGQTGVWTFAVPDEPIESAHLVIELSADDHGALPEAYEYTLWSGSCAHETPVPLRHGLPANAAFNNWMQIDLPADDAIRGQKFTVALTNRANGSTTSSDWIAVKSIELRVAKPAG